MLHKFFVAISIVSVVAGRPAVVVAVELVDVHSSIQATFWQHCFPAMAPWKEEEWEPFVVVDKDGWRFCCYCGRWDTGGHRECSRHVKQYRWFILQPDKWLERFDRHS